MDVCVSLPSRKRMQNCENCWRWICLVIKKGPLRQFGLVECKDDTDWIKRCTTMKVHVTKPRGRPRKTSWDGVKEDMKKFGLSRENVHSRREKTDGK